jgi:Xaa-Pro aminopeptidase
MDLTQVQDALLQNHLDGWLLYDFRGQNSIAAFVAGLSNSGSRRWFLWIPAQGRPKWLIHAIERSTFTDVRANLAGEMNVYVSWQQLSAGLRALIGAHEDRTLRIAMEYSPMNAVPYVSKIDAGIKEFVETSTGAEIVSSADLVQIVQAVLTPEQLESHRRAAAHCLAAKDAAFAYIAERLRTGATITEYDVQQFILERFAAADLDPDHPPIVAVNRHAADPHYAPTAARHSPIRLGDAVLIDLWARERGNPDACFADITWTAFCGAETPQRAADIFHLVAAARDAAVAFVQGKLSAGAEIHGFEVDDACRSVIQQAGYGEHFLHRTGHSLGSALHFTGVNIDNLETQDRRRLMPGVMFTIEPGIYLPDFNFDDSPEAKGLGIRSEINCIVHENRLEVTTLPLQTELTPLLH